MAPSPILVLHVVNGSLGLLSGAIALSFRKGSRPHAVSGTVFFISMLTASAAGAYLAIRNVEMDNIFGGMTFYLVATAWRTAKRRGEQTDSLDWIGLAVALTITAAAAIFGIEAALSPTHMKYGSPASGFVLPGVVALIAAVGDGRLLLRGSISGTQRVTRHLWRMCFALFVASASIFLARPQLFPTFLTKTHILFLLGVLPLVMLAFWLIRVQFTHAFKNIG